MLSKRLKEILGDRGLSIGSFAEMCDLPVETVRNIYYGKTADPKVSTVMQMSKALDMSVNYLMSEYNDCPERELLSYYRSCGNHGRSLILLTAIYEATAARAERNSFEKHRIPCLLPSKDIKNGIVYDSCEIVEIETIEKNAFVAIKIPTNDFAPVFCKDDIMLLANKFPVSGQYAVFYRGDRAFIRKYIEEDGMYKLQCIHNMGEELVMKRMELEYIGTCCGIVRT